MGFFGQTISKISFSLAILLGIILSRTIVLGTVCKYELGFYFIFWQSSLGTLSQIWLSTRGGEQLFNQPSYIPGYTLKNKRRNLTIFTFFFPHFWRWKAPKKSLYFGFLAKFRH
jgi:hypothetical protein